MTTLHRADDVRIVAREAATLVAAGHDVHVVARVDEPSVAHGVAFHPIGVSTVTPGPQHLARRLRAALRAARGLRPDVYHLHDPELLPLVLPLKAIGARVVYDAHEDVRSEVIAYATSRLSGRALSGAWAAAETVSARLLDGVVAATPTIAARFPRRKTVLVRNFPVRGEAERFAGPPLAGRPPVALYLGGISALRGARELVEAIGLVRDPSARLVLAGQYQPPGLREELRALPGWTRVLEAGWLSRADVADALRSARVGLVVLHPVAIHLDALPVKLFEYMAAGLPVIASEFLPWREIVDGERCGLLVDPHDPRAVASAIEHLLANPDAAEEMGRRGRLAFEQRYNWDTEGVRLLELYERLARARAAS